MAKKAKKQISEKAVKKEPNNIKKTEIEKDPDYLYKMSYAGALGMPHSLFHMFPAILFSAITILIVRLHIYSRPMSRYFWTSEADDSQLSDFFSYDKMVFIMVVACMALVVLLFMLVSQSMAIKRTIIYIPMCVYALFVLISYFGSENKLFALWGYNDRFEGTIPLLAYMVMLFFVITVVNSERNVKQLLWVIAISGTALSILGITQALDHDFFRTVMGQKLISPNYALSDGSTLWQAIEMAFAQGHTYYNFTFQNREIYQTVYNINYVSFYLTLLIPLFGMLFVRAFDNESNEPLWKKIALGVLFALLIYNFIGSASSGGFLGLGVIGILGIVLLNKQLKAIWKPLVVLFVITGIVFGITASRWVPELKNTFLGLGTDEAIQERPYIDYIRTGDVIEFSVNGAPLFIDYDSSDEGIAITVKDSDGKIIDYSQSGDGYLSLKDDRFSKWVKLSVSYDNSSNLYLVVNTDGETNWYFTKADGQIYYVNGLGNLVELGPVEHSGFANHQTFGSGRGYIWSRSIPLLKHTIIKGYGADTYCLVYPQNDYAGKYNSILFPRDIIVDKPHNMYLNVGIGTGVISLIALLAVYGIYVVQSIKLYWKRSLGTDFLTFVGFGLLCGLTAFMVTGFVDDSTVSVMPLFYTLLGTGVAVNMMVAKKDKQAH